MHVVIYHGEKPTSLEDVDRKFFVDERRHNALDLIHFENKYKVERMSGGWVLYSPTGKRVAIHGWLEI